MKTAPRFYKLNLTEEQIKVFKRTYWLDWRLSKYFAIEGAKASYAKEVTWAMKPFFWDDVEIPSEDVSIEESQSIEGQHKTWNKYQKDLVELKSSARTTQRKRLKQSMLKRGLRMSFGLGNNINNVLTKK